MEEALETYQGRSLPRMVCSGESFEHLQTSIELLGQQTGNRQIYVYKSGGYF